MIRQTLRHGGTHLRAPTGFCGFFGGFCLLDGVICHCGISAILQSVSGAIAEFQIVFFVSQRVLRANDGVGGQTDKIIQRGDGDIVIVLNVDEILLSVGKFDLRFKHVNFGDGADAELSVDVAQMFLQSYDFFFVHAD